MECKNCNVKLIKGRLVANGTAGIDMHNNSNSFLKKWFLFGGLGNTNPMFGKLIHAYKCPQCNEITLRANS